MNVEYLIQLLNNKLIVLNNAKIQAFNSGDLVTINTLDEDILATEATLNQLRLLQTINLAATSTNVAAADIVTSGIEAITTTTPTVQGPSASAIVNGYDISAYATDPTHESTIQTIVAALPVLVSALDIDTYIKSIAPESPVTGDMVLNAVATYPVDIPLLIAIIQNDSCFGTLGIGARTNNPGNVGNTGTVEKMFDSWDLGVTAVAEWLSRHKV
jgi:hypothetical protein